MKSQIVFSGENKKNITNLPPSELAQRVVNDCHFITSTLIFSSIIRLTDPSRHNTALLPLNSYQSNYSPGDQVNSKMCTQSLSHT